MLRVYATMLPRLQAEESLALVNAFALAAGRGSARDAALRALRRTAEGDRDDEPDELTADELRDAHTRLGIGVG
jgi:hypothetical protein